LANRIRGRLDAIHETAQFRVVESYQGIDYRIKTRGSRGRVALRQLDQINI
jgi:Ni,Fe-hydrogenase III large subunit